MSQIQCSSNIAITQNIIESKIFFIRGKNIKYLPYAFTENGVAMLSSVLNSERAIQVNIQIMRAFNELRELMIEHSDLRKKIESMEKKYDQQFKIVFNAIKQLLEPS